MAAPETPRRPGPMDRIRRDSPRTGPGVPNMGGTNPLPLPPQRTNLPTPPNMSSNRPGPAPTAGGRTLPLPPVAVPTPTPAPVAGQPSTFMPASALLPQPVAPQPGQEGQPAPGQEAQTPQPGQPAAPAVGQGPSGPANANVAPQTQAPGTPGTTPAAPMSPVNKGYQVTGQVDYVPESYELDSLQPGQAVTTPHGDVYRDPSGKLKLKLNEQGKAAYQQARVEKIKRFGNYPGMEDPNAPAPPVNPRGPDFNPFAPPGSGWIE